MSAEHELIQLMTSEDYQEKRNEVLRNFCQYNLDNLLEKEESIKECRNVVSEDNFAEEQPIQGAEILEEIRALNYLNLSLEVKYSFKGFAGLMHMLVLILSILVDTFISKISFPMQPGPEIGSISDA